MSRPLLPTSVSVTRASPGSTMVEADEKQLPRPLGEASELESEVELVPERHRRVMPCSRAPFPDREE
jgi:hypothetical protein